MVEGGRTAVSLPADELADLGYRLAIYPNSLTRLIGRQGAMMLEHLAREGTTRGLEDQMLGPITASGPLFDYPEWTALEARFAQPE